MLNATAPLKPPTVESRRNHTYVLDIRAVALEFARPVLGFPNSESAAATI